MKGVTAHLERLGGVLIAPRRTLSRALAGDGNLFELLPWLVLIAMATGPAETGQTVLIARSDPLAGVMAFVTMVVNRTSPAFTGLLIGSAALYVSGRIASESKKGNAPSFDRCLDAVSFVLVPYLLLAAVGVTLSALGLELWFLPHRLLKGTVVVYTTRVAVGYGWSLALLGVLAFSVMTGVAKEDRMADGREDSSRSVVSRGLASGTALAVLLGLAFLLVVGQIVRVATGPAAPGKGERAPAFAAATPVGTQAALAEQDGKVVLIDFWATWCPPCVASMPSLEKLYREYGQRGFVVLGVNQEPDDVPAVKRFIADYSLTFPVLLDPGGIARSYGVYSFPTSYLIGRDGVIRAIHRGPASESKLREQIEPLLAEAAPSSPPSLPQPAGASSEVIR